MKLFRLTTLWLLFGQWVTLGKVSYQHHGYFFNNNLLTSLPSLPITPFPLLSPYHPLRLH